MSRSKINSVLNSDPNLAGMRKRITELLSLKSDDSRYSTFRAQVTGARQALSLIYFSTYLSYWESEDLVRSVAQMAYLKNYQGQWQDVQDFLEYKMTTPEEFEIKYIERYGPHDFFGNFIREARRNLLGLKVVYRLDPDTRKVKIPQRIRGYNDKGSLCPISTPRDRELWARPERIDKRGKVSHPLLKQEFSDGERPGKHILAERKEVNHESFQPRTLERSWAIRSLSDSKSKEYEKSSG